MFSNIIPMIISQANCDEQNSFASHYFPKDGDFTPSKIVFCLFYAI